MDEQNSPDIDAGTIGTGCATSVGMGCLHIFLFAMLLAMSGFDIIAGHPENASRGIIFVGFLTGLVGNVIVGYVTARKAPRAKMLHAIIVGALAILASIVSLVFYPKIGSQNPWSFLSYLIAIPLNMLGAQWAISSEKTP